MPNLLIPQLPSSIRQFGVCAIVQNADPQLLAWIRDHPSGEFVAKHEDSANGEERWIEGTLEAWDDKQVHFHLEFLKNQPDDTDTKPRTLQELINVCDAFLDVAGIHKANVRARLVADLSSSDLAKGIRALIDADPGGGLCLSSIDFSIHDDIFYRLSVKTHDDISKASATLFAGNEVALDQDLCDNMAQLMIFGLDKFVFGKSLEDASRV